MPFWENKPEFKRAILAGMDTSGRGIEIAPYFYPMILKTEMDVRYVDCVCTEELRAKAAKNPEAVGREVPEVDYVWTPGKPLRDCIGQTEFFDYAIASHVLEHVPNPIGWLNEILSVLKIGAKFAIVLPDKRASGDCLRNETTAAQLMGWWMEQRHIPTPGQIFDFLAHSVERIDGEPFAFPGPFPSGDLKRSYSDHDALNFMTWSYTKSAYLDVHCTVWTPDFFTATMRQLVDIGVLNVSISEPMSQPTEFAVHFTKRGEPAIPAPPPKENELAKMSIPQHRGRLKKFIKTFGISSKRIRSFWTGRPANT